MTQAVQSGHSPLRVFGACLGEAIGLIGWDTAPAARIQIIRTRLDRVVTLPHGGTRNCWTPAAAAAATAGGRPSIASTSARPPGPIRRRARGPPTSKVASLRLGIDWWPKASEDLPEPETPENTTERKFRGDRERPTLWGGCFLTRANAPARGRWPHPRTKRIHRRICFGMFLSCSSPRTQDGKTS